MTACTACGFDVTNKKFCPQCGTPVQTASPHVNTSASLSVCPRCNGEVKPGAAFCIHCGSALSTQQAQVTPPQPVMVTCPACNTQVSSETAFCTNCGHNMHASTPLQATPPTFCTNCGKQNAPGMRFCASCGSQLGNAAPVAGYDQYGQYQQPQQQSQYPAYPQNQPYGQTQYPQYPQQTYPQSGYQPQPMVGQQPMVLRCPVCQAMAPVGTPACVSCRTSLAGVIPTPANVPVGQQGGFAGFLEGNNGKMAMGALGGAAAVIGGEMLLHEIEGNRGYGREGYRREEEGPLGGLGEIANDLGLF